MTQNRDNARFYRSVFRRVLSVYDEVKSIQGTMSCAGFYAKLGSGAGSMGHSSRVVRVSDSDFICDVELAARRALAGDENELFYFQSVYIDKDERFDRDVRGTLSEERMKQLVHNVQAKVGKILSDRGIYPLQNYKKARDLR